MTEGRSVTSLWVIACHVVELHPTVGMEQYIK